MPLPAQRALAAAILAALLFVPAAFAVETPDRDSLATRLDRLTVVGNSERADEAAGSAHYLDQEQLQAFGYSDAHRVLRQLPGVYLVDEEGFGLRPNIGIRGSGTDRNSRITVMEDGILIAPAAYAAPAAYYFPTMARMSAVEVRKGSSAILAGPRTTGGTVNLLSTPIPTERSGRADLAFGSDASWLGHAWVGGSGDRIGYLVETAQQTSDGFKRLDGGGDTGYRLEDYLVKFRLGADPDAVHYQEVELKLVSTEQDSDETYLGLTDADFAASPTRRYAASQLDNIVTDHEQVELRHRIELSTSADLTTVAYRHEFARNWYKLDNLGGTSLSAILANPSQHAERLSWLGGATSPDDALTLRNNNRSYYARGVQSVLGWLLEGERASHQLQVGLRYHEDEEDRFQDDDRYRMDNGRMVLTTDGAPGSQTNRVGNAEAWSLYLQDEIRFGSFIVTPGLRYESIDLRRLDYARTPQGRAQGPTQVIDSSVSAFTPGIGATWLLADAFNVFASVHRGFNPPGPGSNADPEESVNLEAGLRYRAGALAAELVGFYNDYRNLVGTCTASTGGGCEIGQQFDGGEATVRGLEASMSFDANAGGAFALPLTLAYTFTDAEFDSSFSSSFGEWGTVSRGDQLPYLPEHQLHLGAGIEAERWRLNLGANYLDAMRTRAGQGPVPAELSTDDAWVLDLAAGYRFTPATELYVRVENAGDQDYIVSRRPAGARPGRPRSAFVGMRVTF